MVLVSSSFFLLHPEGNVIRAARRHFVLDDPEKIEWFVPLIWSVWPLARREAGWQNDIQQFEHLALPAEEIRVPTLIIHGTEDVNVPVSRSEHLVDRVPGARLHIVRRVDHMMSLTRREEVNTAIDEFLRVTD